MRLNPMRRAFSLIELLLALALSVILMGLVGTALSFFATNLETRNTEVRHVHLVQSVVNLMTDDLRSVIYPPEFDASALDSLIGSATGTAEEQAGEGQDLSAAGLDDMSEGSDESIVTEVGAETANSAETSDLSSGSMISARPGLIGNQTQIQFEISRLPRLEEYQPMLAGAGQGQVIDVPSDIKTVTYFIQPSGGAIRDPMDSTQAGAAMLGANGTASTGGLVRRSLDRAITDFAMTNSGGAVIAGTGDLIAPEVVSLQFRYFDGILWQIYWDSDEQGGLPLAIEVTLEVMEQSPTEIDPNSVPSTRQYVQIIRLPMARPILDESTEDLSSAGI